MKKYRNEWKFVCSNCDIELLKKRLNNVLKIDSYSNENGVYYIHSLYFDDFKNTCAKETTNGSPSRFKWRLRYYGEFNGILKLEKKEKEYGMCHKRTCSITTEEYNEIMNGDISKLFWNTNKKLLKEFLVDIMIKGFSPKVIIDYERTAYIEPITNIRITLDTNISSSYEIEKFITGGYIQIPIQEKNYHVLEVKFDYILPGYIKNLVSSHKFIQTSFSKYYLGFKRMDGVLK